jgi:hypothetical protein
LAGVVVVYIAGAGCCPRRLGAHQSWDVAVVDVTGKDGGFGNGCASVG